MPNVQAPQSQYDFIEADGQSEIVNVPIDVEDDEDDEDYNLSDFSESDDDIIEDFGMEDDGINRAIGGKQLEGVWNGEGDSDHGDSDELRSAEGSSDDEGNSRPRFPEFNQRIGMENVQLVKDQKFASHVIFKEALKEWCIKEKHDFEYKHNDKWRVTAVCKKKNVVGRYMHPKHKWEMPFKSKVLKAFIRVARIIRIVRFLQGG